MLQPIEYKDVSYYALTGIAEKTYTGDSLFQSDVVCELDASQYELTSYHNNINAGSNLLLNRCQGYFYSH